jgi:threonine/homoserine efflux transporter RhtA
MNIHLAIQPLIALIAGVIILIAPRFLNYVVAIYLIIVGVLGLFPNLLHHIG